jgi:hypothetical protein
MDHPDIPPADHGTTDLPSVQYPPPAAVSNDEARLKYVDDLSLAECVRLDTNLVSDGDTLVLPPERMHLQKGLDDICISAELHETELIQKQSHPFQLYPQVLILTQTGA